jgi:copper chaperone CopZ
MSIVSSVPGRIRLESRKLIGKTPLCLLIEDRLNALQGVTGADISPRTGSVLIKFDASRTSEEVIMSKVRYLLDNCDNLQEVPAKKSGKGKDTEKMNDLLIHSLIDITGHMLMPRPLGLLFPIAVHAVRKAL